MITFMSSKITNLLYEKKIIESDEKEVYRYGYEIFISSVISFLIVASVGVLTNRILESAVFYVVFVLTRHYCGGYHASTYLKCNIIFTLIYLAVLLFSSILTEFYSVFYLGIFSFVYLSAIFGLAPIDSENKRLDDVEKKRVYKISVVLGFILVTVSLALYFILTGLSIVISLTLFSVTMLMVIEKLKRKESML